MIYNISNDITYHILYYEYVIVDNQGFKDSLLRSTAAWPGSPNPGSRPSMYT